MVSTATDWKGQASRKEAKRRLVRAVGQDKALSRAGMGQRFFAYLFKGLVYPQIWEDPDVDMAALRIEPGHRIVTIASGGCNALSYLIADPARIESVDLNPAHVSFNRLKIAALKALPDYDAFFRFYGRGDEKSNVVAYQRLLRPLLDPQSRAYWDGRTWLGRRRISIFSRNVYRHGLLGLFIGAGHRVARLYGIDPNDLLKAKDTGRAARLLRHGHRADLRPPRGALGNRAQVDAVRPRHSAAAI